MWEGWVYVPKDKDLMNEVIQPHHDTYVAGHPGRFNIAELFFRNYWWPRIHGDVRAYVGGCSMRAHVYKAADIYHKKLFA